MWKKYKKIPLEKVYDQIQPLDLLQFRGKDFLSDTIRFAQEWMLGDGTFSHSGIVVNKDLMPWLKKLQPNKLYVLESTMSYSLFGMTDGVPDAIRNKGVFGVQIRLLDEVLEAYINLKEDSFIAWYPLETQVWVHSNEKE